MDPQGKLEITENTSLLFTEIKERMNELMYQWTSENYSEIVQIIYANNNPDNCNEYTDSQTLYDIFCENLILSNQSTLKDVIINSGIIQDYRYSIYLYCCEVMEINQYQMDQDPDDPFDIQNNEQMAIYFLLSYQPKILVNAFIDIRDGPILK